MSDIHCSKKWDFLVEWEWEMLGNKVKQISLLTKLPRSFSVFMYIENLQGSVSEGCWVSQILFTSEMTFHLFQWALFRIDHLGADCVCVSITWTRQVQLQTRQNYVTTGRGVGHYRVHHPTKWAAVLQSGPQKLLRRTGIMCVCVWQNSS